MTHTPDQQHNRIDWIHKALADQSAGAVLDVKDIVATPYSYVMEIKTSSGTYYFKETPPDLFIEAKILSLLHRYYPEGAFPHIIFADENTHRFLMTSCGTETLRTSFKGTLDSTILIKAITHYTDIQKVMSDHLADFKDSGIENWSLDHFPQLYSDFIEQRAFLEKCGLNDADLQELNSLKNKVSDICSAIHAYGLPDTLNHLDFQDNNMLVDKHTGKVAIIDWGEVTIGNPLMSLVGCFKKACRRYQVTPDSAEYHHLRNAFFANWELPADKISPLYDKISAIDYIYYALSLVALLKNATTERVEWYERIKIACLSFINECATIETVNEL